MSKRYPAAALTAVAAAATLLGPLSAPASADEPPAVTVSTSVDGGRATVSGHADMSGLLAQITSVHVKVFRASTQVSSCDDDGCGATLGQPSTSFSLDTPALAYNGPYRATVAATGHALINGVLGADATGEGSADFQIEVKPAPPANVKAVVNPDRTVTVSWSRNTEPDLVGYQVQRRAGSSAFTTVSPAISQPSSGSTVRFTDSSTATAGGTFEYVVLAVRPDGDGSVSGRATSQSAVTSAVTVAGADGQVPPISAAGGTPGAAKPGGSATPVGFDVSSFVASGSRSTPPKIAVPGAPLLPDGTFVSTLPFSVPSGQAASSPRGASDNVDIREAGSSGRRSLLLPIAAGLVLCVVAFHVRLFNRMVGGPAEPRELPVHPVADEPDYAEVRAPDHDPGPPDEDPEVEGPDQDGVVLVGGPSRG